MRTLEERFWAKVRKGEGDGCWVWTASIRSDGYGRLRVGGTTKLTHRVSWELNCGALPDGLCVLHRCDNPPCVNPDHLFLGTHQDNIRDRDQKGRNGHCLGQKHGRSKLKTEDVMRMRRIFSTGKIEQKTLAQFFGVSDATVSFIITRKRWAHLPEDPFAEITGGI